MLNAKSKFIAWKKVFEIEAWYAKLTYKYQPEHKNMTTIWNAEWFRKDLRISNTYFWIKKERMKKRQYNSEVVNTYLRKCKVSTIN